MAKRLGYETCGMRVKSTGFGTDSDPGRYTTLVEFVPESAGRVLGAAIAWDGSTEGEFSIRVGGAHRYSMVAPPCGCGGVHEVDGRVEFSAGEAVSISTWANRLIGEFAGAIIYTEE